MGHKNISFKDWKEARRKRAFELKEHGWKQCEIAEALGVSKAAVSQWMVKMDKSDTQAWRAKLPGHRPPKLTAEELRLLPEFLSHGAEAYRFRGELWTCACVASVIKEECGVPQSTCLALVEGPWTGRPRCRLSEPPNVMKSPFASGALRSGPS